MRVEPFGECDLGPVQRITIGARPGPVLQVLDLGACAHRLEITCADERRRNVVLGHSTAQAYLDATDYIGGVIGRYANRIAGGRFAIDGNTFQVAVNDRGNHLHGGPDGFDRRRWSIVDGDTDRVVLRLQSPDGDQGFPGNLTADVSYTVSESGVRVELAATTDAATPVNLTSHAYVNLNGEGTGTAEDHLLQVDAEHYLPIDATGIPLGGLTSVGNSPFDLRSPTPIAEAVRSRHPQVRSAGGIDHNYAVIGAGLRRMATLEAPRTHTRLELFSDRPGLQVYTGNFLEGTAAGTSGGRYRPGDGIALEPQLFPDSPNHPEFDSPTLRPGQEYRATLEWRFTPTR